MTGLCRVNLSLLVYKVFNFTFWGSLGCYLMFVPLYFKQIGLSPSQIGLASSFRPLFGFLFLPFIAAAADRFHCRRAVLFCSVALADGILVSFAALPHPSQVPCDLMEHQIWEKLHLNISLPYQEHRSPYNLPIDTGTLSTTPTVLKRNSGEYGVVAPSWTNSFPAAQQSSGNQSTVNNPSQFPPAITKTLFANQSWLYDQSELGIIFAVILVISSFIDVVLFSSTCQSDNATLDALRREHGNVDQYGLNRGFGTLGWGACSLATGFLLNSTRTIKVSCGIEHTITSYWAAFALAIGMSVIALLCAAYFKFSYDEKNDVTTSSWGAVKTVLFSWHYGSIMIMLIFLGMCNGCVWAFLFWHLENLGATQGLLGVLTVIMCVSEFGSGFLSGWAIPTFGHIALLSMGLALYVARFCCYYLIQAPWLTIFVEPIQGMCFIMTWTTSVSYMTQVVPPDNRGTMQGFLISAHFGLGGGLGYLLSGLLVTRLGAPWTFVVYAFSCTVFLCIFLAIQWFSKVPSLPWKSNEDVKPLLEDDDREQDREEPRQTLLTSPENFSLNLPEFTFTTKAVGQQYQNRFAEPHLY